MKYLAQLFSPEGSPSSETLPEPKPAAKKRAKTAKPVGKSPKRKSAKRSVAKASAKKKPAAKRVKTSKRAAPKAKRASKAEAVGRPFLYPENTLARLPKGYLAAMRAKAKKDDISQGDIIREGVRRVCGIEKKAA